MGLRLDEQHDKEKQSTVKRFSDEKFITNRGAVLPKEVEVNKPKIDQPKIS